MKTVLRNMMVFNPLAILACCGLGVLVSHRTGAALAAVALGLGFVIPWLPCFGRLVDRHAKVAYTLSAIAWLIGAARVGWFWARVTM